MSAYVLSADAERDLDEIANYYLPGDQLEYLDKILKGILEALLTLADEPGLGHLRDDLVDQPPVLVPK